MQVRYFFGGEELVQAVTGLTYAEYARRGFFELVAVAALLLGVLLAVDWLARDVVGRARHALRLLTVVLLTFIGPWNEFLWPFLITKQASMQPLAVALANFISLDPMQLSEAQLAASTELLAQRAHVPMLPFNEIAADEARAELDCAFLGGILGLPVELFSKDGPLDLLRRKLAAEPSILGSKKRPAK